MVVLAALAMTTLMASAQGVDDPSIFELEVDANLVVDLGQGGLDWAGVPAGDLHHVADAPNASIFDQGGSKDTNGISAWRWKNGSVPDKDNIQNGYGYATFVNGQLYVYFAGDRTANNGDANAGFWFFQNPVGLNMDGTGTFSGNHRNGDLFVVAAFSSGGQVGEFKIYQWSCSTDDGPACDATGSLVLLGNGAQCDPATGTSNACATANDTPVAAIHPYTPKSGTPGIYPVASFYEGGVNLGSFGIEPTVCFSTFMVETRSSTSETAQLKDFTLGAFQSCGIEISKVCPGTPTINQTGDKLVYQFGGIVKNSGTGTLHNVTVTDTFLGDNVSNISPNGSCVGNVCTYNLDQLAGNTCKSWPHGLAIDCDADLSDPTLSAHLGTFESTSNGGELDSVTVGAAFLPGGDPDDVVDGPKTANCNTNAVVPTLTISKTCETSTSTSLVTTVGFSGTVCNQSPYQVTSLTAMDVQTNSAGDMTIGPGGTVTLDKDVLAPCPDGDCNSVDDSESCAGFTGSYTPSQVSGGTNACSYFFKDKVTATGSLPPFAPTATVSGSNFANCPLCPCP